MDYIQIATAAIPTLATLIVGYILRNQIKSQNEILTNYKDYIQTTDWKKVKEMYENFTIPEIESRHVKDKLNTLRDVYIQKQKHDDRMQEEFQEMLAVAVFGLSLMKKEDAKKVIASLTYGGSAIQDLLDDNEQQSSSPNSNALEK